MEAMKFDIKITADDLSNFILQHNYKSLHGLLSVVISLAALVYLIVDFNQLDMTKRVLLLVIALLFIVVNPLMLKLKAKTQVKRNKSFENPITYELYDKGFSLTQAEETVEIEWSNVWKAIDTGRSLVLYITSVRAFIWPKTQLGEQYPDVVRMLKTHLKPVQMKIKEK